MLTALAATAALMAGSGRAAGSDRPVDAAYENALALLAQGRPSAAYGQLIRLAEAGHAAAARMAIAMCEHGPEVWGRDWDCTPDELADWARAAGMAAPVLEPRRYDAHGRPRSRLATTPTPADRRLSAPRDRRAAPPPTESPRPRPRPLAG
jgi:hypothetical protein